MRVNAFISAVPRLKIMAPGRESQEGNPLKKVRHFTLDKDIRYVMMSLGLNEKTVLREAELPLDLFQQRTIALDSQQYFRFWSGLGAAYQGDSPLPLRLVDLPILGNMGAPVMAALCAPNFQICVKRIQEFKPLIGPLRLTLTETDHDFSVQFDTVDGMDALPPLMIAAELLFFVVLIRQATGETIVPTALEATTELTHPGYQSYFGQSVTLGLRNRVTYSLEDSLKPFKLRNDKAWDFFEPEFRQRLDELDAQASFTSSVQSALMESLPLGVNSIECISEKLFISPRTLQRRLKKEETGFQEQLNYCREKLANHYLLNTDLSVTEIAFMVGYKDTSSFSRSFSLWTGHSPEKYRTHHRAESSVINHGKGRSSLNTASRNRVGSL